MDVRCTLWILIMMVSFYYDSSGQSAKENLIYELTIANRQPIDDWRESVLDVTGVLFNEYSADQIGVFLDSISSITDTLSDIQARAYVISAYCAYLNNTSQFEEAEACCLQEIDLGKSYNNPHVLAGGYEDIAFIYNHQGRYKEQIEVLKKAVTVRREANHSFKDIGYAIMWLGEAYSYLQEFDSAYYYLDEVQDLVEQSGDSSFLCNVYEKISRVALEQGDFEKSVDNSEVALAIANKLEDKIRRQTNLMYLGYSSYYLGNYEEAITYELEGLAEYEGEENSSTASSYVRLGRIYNGIEDYDQAIDYLQRAIDYNQSTEYDVGVAKAAVEIALSYTRKGSFDIASEKLEFAKEVFEETDDARYLSMVLRREALLADARGNCDEALQKIELAQDLVGSEVVKQTNASAKLEFAEILANCSRFSEAYQHALSASEILERQNDIHGLEKAYTLLYQLSNQFNNPVEALEHLEAAAQYRSQITNQKNRQAIASERARFDVELADERASLAYAKNAVLETRNRFYLYAAFGLIGIVGLLIYFINRIRGLNFRLEDQNRELLKLNHTKDRFFGIIAHDLRSPLAAFQGVGNQIRSYVKKGNNDKLIDLSGEIEETSTNLSALLDNLLNWSLMQLGSIPHKPKVLKVRDEVEDAMDIFLPVARKKGVNLTISVDDTDEVFADTRAFQTIIRNLIANAVKYTSQGGRIEIGSHSTPDKLSIVVSDSGKGMTVEQLDGLWQVNKESTAGTSGEKGTGLGLLLCKELTELNEGEIHIKSSKGIGTTVTVSFPPPSDK